MTSKVGVGSPSVEEASSGGNIRGGVPLKKGPWTKEEDAVLMDYIRKHGEGNWSAVQKHSGLARCGKSCRLRWSNHLRPDLKKGALTLEEVRRINELHAKIGNKWAQIAAKVLDEMVLTIQDGVEAGRPWIWFALSPRNVAGPRKKIRPLMRCSVVESK